MMPSHWRDACESRPATELLGLSLHPVIASVLRGRGVRDAQAVRALLVPSIDDLPDPFGLPDMDLAVTRLAHAVRTQETVLVLGDYDVDGITSAALLAMALREAGGQAVCAIPDRSRDGHGFTLAGLALAQRLDIRVVVTADSGTSSVEAIAEAGRAGIDVIVVDHHQPQGALPAALAVVNPRRLDSQYGFRDLAAVGVAYRVAQALFVALGRSPRYVDRHLDLVALGTLADSMPLVGENRILTRLGLEVMQQGQRAGLAALRDVCGRDDRILDSSFVMLTLAPRVNAAGRLGHAQAALRLLMTPDRREAQILARQLEEANRRRRRLAESVVRDGLRAAEEEPHARSIVADSAEWHPAVLGIAAARILEDQQRPVALIVWRGDEGKGSARAPAGHDLPALLAACGGALHAFGGHAVAAGFTLRRADLPAFRRQFEAAVLASALETRRSLPLLIDGPLALEDCDAALAQAVSDLGPFGMGHPEPLFAMTGVVVSGPVHVVGRNALRFRAHRQGVSVECLGVGLARHAAWVNDGARVALAATPVLGSRTRGTEVELKVRDMVTTPSSAESVQ